MTKRISDSRSILRTEITETKIIAATIAVIILEINPSTIVNKAIKRRYGIAVLIHNTPDSIGFWNQRNNKPAISTANVILIGLINASFTSGQSSTWLTSIDKIPIINKNTSKFLSTSFVNGKNKTRISIIINPAIINIINP